MTKPAAAVLSTLEPPFDETALAQLGAAVVLQWRDLPGQTRDQLLETAEAVAGLRSVRDVRDRLEGLIARHLRRALKG